MYSAPTTRIKINGRSTDHFNFERSTHQGYPLSPTLFALYIETLAQAVRENNHIEGISLRDNEHKIALYADDVLLYIHDPNVCLHVLFDLLDEFGSYSGYKLNIQKTQIQRFNYNPSSKLKKVLPVDWSQKAIKHLRVWLTHSLDYLYKKNYGTVNQKIKEDLNNWSTCLLNLSARVDTIKMSLLPKLLYLFLALPVRVPISQFQERDKHLTIYLGRKKTKS